MKKQLNIFFTALMFYTRIPCPKNITHDEEYLNKSTRYFPFIGWIVGTICYFVFISCNMLFPPLISIVLMFIASVLITGAFHEDGFADVCDGFGGGWTKEKIISIMKDSAIGAYGAIGIVLLFSLKIISFYKWFSLGFLNTNKDYGFLYWIFIVYHSLSRGIAISITFVMSYVSDSDKSKSKPIVKSFSGIEVIGVCVFSLIPVAILCFEYSYKFVIILPILWAVRNFMKEYYQKWIGGYTGDCLGALQQISEVFCILTFLALCKYT